MNMQMSCMHELFKFEMFKLKVDDPVQRWTHWLIHLIQVFFFQNWKLMRRNLIASFRRWISVSDGQRGGCVTRMTKRIMDGYWSDGIWKTKPARARIDTCRTLVMFHLPNDQQRRIIDKVPFRWMRSAYLICITETIFEYAKPEVVS